MLWYQYQHQNEETKLKQDSLANFVYVANFVFPFSDFAVLISISLHSNSTTTQSAVPHRQRLHLGPDRLGCSRLWRRLPDQWLPGQCLRCAAENKHLLYHCWWCLQSQLHLPQSESQYWILLQCAGTEPYFSDIILFSSHICDHLSCRYGSACDWFVCTMDYHPL